MIRHLLLPALFLITYNAHLSAQQIVWADKFHGSEEQVVTSITTDEEGYVYSSINFYNNLDADPGSEIINFISAGSQDIAIVKTDAEGIVVWARHLSGDLFENVKKIVHDKAGNIYIIGYFKGTLDFDPSAATHALTAAAEDAYLAKYDSGGNYVWAVQIGSAGYEESYGVSTDMDNNVYLCGYFQNTIDFDPSASLFNMTAIGGNANFFLKLSADGNFIWAKQIAYTFLDGFVTDPDANIYFTGGLYSTVDFDPSAATHNLTGFGFGEDIYVAKYNSDGEYIWAEQMTGSSDEFGKDILYDTVSNAVYVSGYFAGTVDFDPSAAVVNKTSAGASDAFVMRLQEDGSLVWVNTFGNAFNDNAIQLNTDDDGNVHFGGVFSGTVDFDPSVAVFNITSNGSIDIYFSSWDAEGNFINTSSVGSVNEDDLHALHIDNEGAIYIGGYFDGLVDFDPGPGTTYLNSLFTGWDGYTVKYCSSYSITDNISICNGDSIYAGGEWQHDAGTYYDYYTPVEGCDSVVTTILTVINPLLDLGDDIEACEGDAIILDAENTGAEYIWNTGAGTQIINITESGSYSVDVLYPSGCSISDTINIVFHELPVVELGSTIDICAGNIAILDAGNPGADYAWGDGETTQTISVSETGDYSVEVTNSFGCSTTDIIHVSVIALPVIDLGPEIHICAGDSALLDAGNPGSDYLWSTGDESQIIYVDEPGIYSVEVTGITGCAAEAAVFISVYALPIVNLGDDFILCEGSTAILDAENAGSIFNWNTGSEEQVLIVDEAGIYSVEVEDVITGCINADTIEVIEGLLPDVNIVFAHDDTICIDELPLSLEGTPAGGMYSGDGLSGNIFNPLAAGIGAHEIMYTYTDANGCTNSASIILTVEVCQSVNNKSDLSVSIFPNPVKELLYIQSDINEFTALELYDITGKKVYSNEETNDHFIINTILYPQGVYMLKITAEGLNYLQKIIIMK